MGKLSKSYSRFDRERSGGGVAIFAKHRAFSVKSVLTCCLAVYLFAVVWYTVGKREVGYYPGQFSLFGSYRQWMDGSRTQGYGIIANIAMFVPFGFLLPALLRGKIRRILPLIAVLGLAFSCLIETVQFLLLRGFFDFDDIFNNTLGAVLGALLYALLKRLLPEKRLPGAMLAAGAAIVLFCAGLFLFSDSGENSYRKPLSQGLCFQVEKASAEDDGLILSGVCFWYAQGPEEYNLVLQSTRTGEKRSLRTARGLARPDVNEYFRCERDYTRSGFEASCPEIPRDEEYEIILDYGFLRSVSTGVYLTASQQGTVDIHYVPGAVFRPLQTEGTDLEALVSEGTLLAYNPEHHVYVYWRDGSLYWIAEAGFLFEEDQTTRLELVLWTNQPEKQPEKRRAAGNTYDLWAVYFEKNELDGSFGPYRVCAIALPEEYAITSVTTGYYVKKWIWQETFWPVYRFPANSVSVTFSR